jgi:hypothetical protein
MRKAIVLWSILMATLSFTGAWAQEPKAAASPKEVVQKFYEAHFARDMGFTKDSLEAKETWLSPELARLLHQELEKPSNPDEVPNIDGDPFTDSQEYPAAFRLMDVAVKGTSATVRVKFTGPSTSRTIKVLLVLQSGHWRIDDFVYDKDQTLRKLVS